MRISLSWKVSLVVSAVIVIAMAIVGWSVYQSTGHIVQDQINDQITLMSNYQWESITDIFSAAERELQRIAQDQNMRSLADLASSATDINEFLSRNVVQATGSRLEREVNGWDLLHGLSIVTADGIVVSDSRYKEASILDIMAGNTEVQGLDHLGVKLGAEEYLEIPLGATKEYVDKNVVIHSVPINRQGSNTEPIGYLIGALDIESLFASLSTELGEYGNTVLLNQRGVVLNHSDRDRIGLQTDDSWYLTNIAAAEEIAEEMGDESYLALLSLADGELFLGSSISVERMTEPVRNLAKNLITMFLIALVAISMVVAVFVRWQLRPLRVFVNAFDNMESGDLNSRRLFSKRMERRRDEIGSLIKAFISMEENLRSLVETLTRATHETAASTEQLSASSQETSASIEEVAAKASNLSRSAGIIDSAMGQFSSAVEHLDNNSREMNSASTQVNTLAQDGQTLMETTENSMAALLDPSEDAMGSVINLNKAAQEIEGIVAVISDIAEQTNLLSLNASIEAARAGEHGRGFAVVADEVRKLADGTRDSAATIVHIIQQLAAQTNETTSLINVGAKNVQNTKKTFSEIVTLISDLARGVQEMTASIADLSSSTDNIVAEAKQQAVDGEEILAATEEQAAMTAENANMMDKLASMANDLQDLVGRFKAE